ncbi:hypothetical protein [Occallatibacter riparius]|uniref:DUF5666 domain-containing protein n=1 Tax=Occallatibacter riparius TaxID=1002689 RepID=A0A9J7BJA9_9BACT|nr:hypothetical protein [Occallatibacter riparius]UWZ82767.1 hypothetical protein MOP44_19610 [Occallatibacter riparius]
MRFSKGVLVLALLCSLPAMAGDKQKGAATLKDFQPAGTTDTKYQKKQLFDLTFEASGNEYVCRTKNDDKVKATEWPVGGNITYELDEDKAKLKSAQGKKVECKVVRVQAVKPAAAATN